MRSAARKGDPHAGAGGDGGTLGARDTGVFIEGREVVTCGDDAERTGKPRGRVGPGVASVTAAGREIACEGHSLLSGERIISGSDSVLIGDHPPGPEPVDASPTAEFNSTFASSQFEGLARKFPRKEFIAWCAGIFGWDLGVAAYATLHERLLAGAFPRYRFVVIDKMAGEAIYFGERNHEVWIARWLLEAARREPKSAWHLLDVLLHEHGHHVDYVLRNEIRRPGEVDPDAPLEEGARFSHGVFYLGFREGPTREIGTFVDAGASHLIRVEFGDLHRASQELDPAAEWVDEHRADGGEGFPSSALHPNKEGSRGHLDIEGVALADAGFTKAAIAQTQFGNFLRDSSALLGGAFFHRKQGVVGSWTTNGFSSDQLTALVDVIVRMRFDLLDERSRDPSVTTGIDSPNRALTSADRMVTSAILGVYQSHEHLDNPDGIADLKDHDERLQQKCSDYALGVDTTYLTKRYLRTATPAAVETPRFKVSFEHVRRELEMAVEAGADGCGFRHFGAACHALEDWFSHTNYVEVTLAIAGAKRNPRIEVETWANPDGCMVPIVTGTFGHLDAVASVMEIVKPALERLSDRRRGGGSLKQQLLLWDLLIDDFYEDSFLASRDDAKRWIKTLREHQGELEKAVDLASFLDALAKRLQTPVNMVLEVMEGMVKQILRAFLLHLDVPAAVKAGQTLIWVPGSHPTHTMLAKDDDTHPLHGLAARCAQIYIRSLGEHLLDAWKHPSFKDRLLVLVSDLMRHPSQVRPHMHSVDAVQKEIVAWATDDNLRLVSCTAMGTRWQRALQRLHDEVLRYLRTVSRQRPRDVVDAGPDTEAREWASFEAFAAEWRQV